MKMFTTSAWFLLLLISNLSAQVEWRNFANDFIVRDIEVADGHTWIGTHGGLIKINVETGEKETFEAWNSGLRGIGVNEVEIAADGTKWFGGDQAGLFRLKDGVWDNFVFVNTGDTLFIISRLKLDPAGNPWFISDTFGPYNGTCNCKKLISYNGTEFVNHQANLGLPEYGGVENFVLINETEVWVQLEDRIVRYNGSEITSEHTYGNIGLLENESIRDFAVAPNDQLVLSTIIHGESAYRIIRFDGDQWIVDDGDAPGNAYYAAFNDPEGNLWFSLSGFSSTQRTYATYDGTSWQYFPSEDIAIPAASGIAHLKEVDADGNWWFSTYTGTLGTKVYRYDGDTITPYDTQITPIASNYVEDVVIDCDDGVWLLDREISRFDGQNWELFPTSETHFNGYPQEAAINPLTCDLWFAVSSGPIVRYDGSEFTPYYIGFGGSSNAVAISDDGVVYVATSGAGLARYEAGLWTIYNSSNAPIANNPYDVLVQDDGTVWIADPWQGVSRLVGETWTVFTPSNSPVSGNGFWVYEDRDGNIWTRSEEGLAKYNGTYWEAYPLDPEIGYLLTMAEDRHGNYLLGSTRGVTYWDGFSTGQTYNIHNSAMCKDGVWRILVDEPNKDTWFVHSSGVSVLHDEREGGNLHGLVYLDSDQDSTFQNSVDTGLPGQRVVLFPDSTVALTNDEGKYHFSVPVEMEYTLSAYPTAEALPLTAATLNVTAGEDPIYDLNFGFWAEDNGADFDLDLVSSQIVCNQSLEVRVIVRNRNFQTATGEVSLSFPAGFEYLSSAPEGTPVSDTEVRWSFTELEFMASGVFTATLVAPGVNAIGDELEFSGRLMSGEQVFYAQEERTLLCSYDPNDKTAVPVGESIDTYSLLGEPLQYTIRFQNMGNYRAKDVVITDQIDPALDINTFEILSYSHPMTTTIASDREVTFRFDDINLPPDEESELGSQGYVKYLISPQPDLPDPTLIENTANIYFDLNPAIVTNTTENVLVEDLSVNTNELPANQRAIVYPNPTRDGCWISWPQATPLSPWTADIYDLNGKLILRHAGSSLRERIDLIVPGFYLLRIRRGKYLQTSKLIVIND